VVPASSIVAVVMPDSLPTEIGYQLRIPDGLEGIRAVVITCDDEYIASSFTPPALRRRIEAAGRDALLARYRRQLEAAAVAETDQCPAGSSTAASGNGSSHDQDPE
ncbi:hypothetical protein JW905_01305, partial [bacterium]|nr:hypothetical protein [candidate division CSSED10-310 bacterium]